MNVLIQIGTILTALWLFRSLSDNRIAVVTGSILYVTCPYRVALSVDNTDPLRLCVWMLLPVYLWAALQVASETSKRYRNVIICALNLVLIGYADVVLFVVIAGCSALTALITRKWTLLSVVVCSLIATLPKESQLIQYLFGDGVWSEEVALQSIMPYGYTVGEWFTSYANRAGRPGIGLGLLIALIWLLWLVFASDRKCTIPATCKVALVWSAVFLVMSLRCFPWDLVQRPGMWAIKAVSLLETPALFFGLASALLCIPAAYGVEEALKSDNKEYAKGMPAVICVAALWVMIYRIF